MKYSHGLLLVRGAPHRHVKPDEVGPDILIAAILLILFIAFFVYWFGAKLRRASEGRQGP